MNPEDQAPLQAEAEQAEPSIETAHAEAGGIDRLIERYGDDPSKCPYLTSLGAAGVELYNDYKQRREAAPAEPTMGELLAAKRAARAAAREQAASKEPESAVHPAAKIEAAGKEKFSEVPDNTNALQSLLIDAETFDTPQQVPAIRITETAAPDPGPAYIERLPAPIDLGGIDIHEQATRAAIQVVEAEQAPADPVTQPEPIVQPPAHPQPSPKQAADIRPLVPQQEEHAVITPAAATIRPRPPIMQAQAVAPAPISPESPESSIEDLLSVPAIGITEDAEILNDEPDEISESVAGFQVVQAETIKPDQAEDRSAEHPTELVEPGPEAIQEDDPPVAQFAQELAALLITDSIGEEQDRIETSEQTEANEQTILQPAAESALLLAPLERIKDNKELPVHAIEVHELQAVRQAAETLQRFVSESLLADSAEELPPEAIEALIIVLRALGEEAPHQHLKQFAIHHNKAEFVALLTKELPDVTKLLDYQQHLLQALQAAQDSSRQPVNTGIGGLILKFTGMQRLAVAA